METQTKYVIDDVSKMAEKDVHGEGCKPESQQFANVDMSFRDPTITGVINKFKHYFGEPVGTYETQQGRIETSRLETSRGHEATETEIERWKNGNQELWNVVYTGYVKKVVEEPVDITQELEEAM